MTGVTAIMAGMSGGSGSLYTLIADGYGDFGILGSDPSAGINFVVGSNGTLTVTGDVSGTLASYDWKTPTTGSTTHYVRATLNSGTFNTGTTGSWLALTSNRSWLVRTTISATRFTSTTFEIATDSGGTNIVASALVTFNVELI